MKHVHYTKLSLPVLIVGVAPLAHFGCSDDGGGSDGTTLTSGASTSGPASSDGSVGSTGSETSSGGAAAQSTTATTTGSATTGEAGSGGSPECPESCDDGNACTVDVQSGDASDCTLSCEHEEITECAAGDACCPAGCDVTSDSDCTATDTSAIPDDRRITWNPGIPGGIPQRDEVCATIDADTYGDGSTDATSAIQDAIDACPEGQVVLLPAGEYRTTGMLSIRTGIVLRGAGPESTSISLDDSGTSAVIRIGAGASNNLAGVAVTAGFDKGSTELTLSDASEFEVGDVVLIDQLDGDLVATGDCSFYKRWSGDRYRSLGQIFEVVAKDGNVIETSSPLYFDYSEDLAPELSPTAPGGTVKYAGIEDLRATRTSDYGGQGHIFHLINAAYSWVKNVEGEKVSGRHVGLETCYRCVVRDSYFHDAWEIDPGASAYGISLDRHPSDNLVENNVVRLLNIPIVLSVSSGGNVIAYNYVEDAVQMNNTGWNTAGIRGHCAFPYMELVEGNYANQAGFDNVHGGAGYVTFFRNYFSAQRASFESDGNVYAVAFDENNIYMNVVGNVLWTAGLAGDYETECGGRGVYQFGRECSPPDPRVAETVLRHGNFDFLNNDVVWDDAITDRALPPSLYLTQKPAFFGDLPWPPMDPTGETPIGVLPAKQRYDTELAD